jgi:hypothetical protein
VGLATGLGLPLPVAAVLLFVSGTGAATMRTATNTSIQLATAPEMRGRVMSVFALVFEGTAPMGGVIAGALAARLGGAAAFVVAGLAAVILIAAGTPELRKLRVEGGASGRTAGRAPAAPAWPSDGRGSGEASAEAPTSPPARGPGW